MKKFKLLVLFFSIFTTLFVSCSTDETVDTQKSAALRIYLNEFKKVNGLTVKNTTASSNVCFEFVYPLTLSYNNGSTVTVANESQLYTVLDNETADLYVNGIAFPFQLIVQGNTTPITITNDDEFWDVINECGINSYDDFIVSGPCYEFVYPFSLLNNNNQTIRINSEQELFALFQSPNNNTYIVDFVYPFSVVYNNTTIQVDNEYEFAEINNDCNFSNCNCPSVINPVCVNMSGVIIEFPNACLAECAGFTSANFVNCN
jgi:hypothetical protein